MARLYRSLAELRMRNPMSRPEWLETATKLIADLSAFTGAAAENTDQLVYIQITRGVALRDHVMPTDITPTVFAMASVMKPPSAKDRTQGVACVTADDYRWQRPISRRPACWARYLPARSAPIPAPPKP